MEATIQNKMRLDKCDPYITKGNKLQGEKILHVSSKKRRKTEGGRKRSTDKLLEPPNKEEKRAYEKAEERK